MSQFTENPPFQESKAVAEAREANGYASNSDRKAGRPHIQLRHRGCVLAEFYEPSEALNWLTTGRAN